MKIGVHYGALGPSAPYEKAFPYLRSCGARGVELVLKEDRGQLSLQSTPEELRHIRRLAEDADVSIFSISNAELWAHPLTSDSAGERQRALDSLYRQMDIALSLGAGNLLVIPGYSDTIFVKDARGVPKETALTRAAEGIARVVPRAEQAGLVLAVENVWNGMMTSARELCDFVDAFHSPAVGIYFDTGNALRFGSPQDMIRILGSRIKAVHLKDALKGRTDMDAFPLPGRGDVDLPACVKALHETGYDGWCTVELHSGASFDAAGHAVRYVSELLRSVIRKGEC